MDCGDGVKAAVLEALRKGAGGGLTAPQVAYAVPYSYEEVKAALDELVNVDRTVVQNNYPTSADPYPRYVLFGS